MVCQGKKVNTQKVDRKKTVICRSVILKLREVFIEKRFRTYKHVFRQRELLVTRLCVCVCACVCIFMGKHACGTRVYNVIILCYARVLSLGEIDIAEAAVRCVVLLS